MVADEEAFECGRFNCMVGGGPLAVPLCSGRLVAADPVHAVKSPCLETLIEEKLGRTQGGEEANY